MGVPTAEALRRHRSSLWLLSMLGGSSPGRRPLWAAGAPLEALQGTGLALSFAGLDSPLELGFNTRKGPPARPGLQLPGTLRATPLTCARSSLHPSLSTGAPGSLCAIPVPAPPGTAGQQGEEPRAGQEIDREGAAAGRKRGVLVRSDPDSGRRHLVLGRLWERRGGEQSAGRSRLSPGGGAAGPLVLLSHTVTLQLLSPGVPPI